MFAWIYKKYLMTLAWIGRIFHEEKPAHQRNRPSVMPFELGHGETFESLDREATAAGNTYRGIGVMVGGLGIAIIFCALAPVIFPVEGSLAHIFDVAKVVLMLAMLLLVIWGIASRRQSKWIVLRSKAEYLRYQELREAIECLKADPSSPANQSALRESLTKILDGHEGQIRYNALKARQYGAIEKFTDKFSWFIFATALIAAVAHLFWQTSWLLLFTAFLPALLGGVHGINGFLRLGDLAEDHEKMANRLQALSTRLAHPDVNDSNSLIELAEAAKEQLSSRDVRWSEFAEKHALRASA